MPSWDYEKILYDQDEGSNRENHYSNGKINQRKRRKLYRQSKHPKWLRR